MIPDSLINFNGDLLVGVDTETTGLVPGYNEIIQIAIVPLNSEIQPHPGIDPFYMNIAPDYPERASGAAAVHGIEMEELMKAPSQEESVEAFDRWFTELDLPMLDGGYRKRLVPLAHNWAFERTFLLHWLGLQTFSEIWSGHPRDTLVLGAHLNDLAAWNGTTCPFNRLNLGNMCEVMGVRLDNAHDALGDVLATAELYRAILRSLS